MAENWKIYYDNGQTYSPEDGRWEDAPADGVLFVVDKQGDVHHHSGADYYWKLQDGTVVATSDLGPLLRSLGIVKFGRWTTHTNMERIRQRVVEEWKGK